MIEDFSKKTEIEKVKNGLFGTITTVISKQDLSN